MFNQSQPQTDWMVTWPRESPGQMSRETNTMIYANTRKRSEECFGAGPKTDPGNTRCQLTLKSGLTSKYCVLED